MVKILKLLNLIIEDDFCFYIEEFIYNLYTDQYNHIIFNKIIRYKLNNKTKLYNNDFILKYVTKNEKNNLIKNSILKIYNKAFHLFEKTRNFIFKLISQFEVVLNLKLKQVPTIFPKLKVKKKISLKMIKFKEKIF